MSAPIAGPVSTAPSVNQRTWRLRARSNLPTANITMVAPTRGSTTLAAANPRAWDTDHPLARSITNSVSPAPASTTHHAPLGRRSRKAKVIPAGMKKTPSSPEASARSIASREPSA
jgi:hypothetical protein